MDMEQYRAAVSACYSWSTDQKYTYLLVKSKNCKKEVWLYLNSSMCMWWLFACVTILCIINYLKKKWLQEKLKNKERRDNNVRLCVRRHTKTTRGNISSNQYRSFATPKLCGIKQNNCSTLHSGNSEWATLHWYLLTKSLLLFHTIPDQTTSLGRKVISNKGKDRSSIVLGLFLPVSTQSLSGWLLSPWIHMAGHLEQKIAVWQY